MSQTYASKFVILICGIFELFFRKDIFMDTIFDTKHLYRTYFKMALPVVLGLVVTLNYNLADTIFIAQTTDTAQIAGDSV